MTDEEIKNILERGATGRLATADKNGQPHVVPLAIFSDGDRILFHTGANTKKVRNLMENPKVSLVVDYILQTPRLEVGFVINGTAKKLEKPEELDEVRKMMTRGGGGGPAHPDPQRPTVLSVSPDQKRDRGRMPAIFEIKVNNITSWKRCELTF